MLYTLPAELTLQARLRILTIGSVSEIVKERRSNAEFEPQARFVAVIQLQTVGIPAWMCKPRFAET